MVRLVQDRLALSDGRPSPGSGLVTKWLTPAPSPRDDWRQDVLWVAVAIVVLIACSLR